MLNQTPGRLKMEKTLSFRSLMAGIQRVMFLILFTLLLFSVTRIMADDYELCARNMTDGSIVVTFDLSVEPEPAEVVLNNQKFIRFDNLAGFIRSTKNGYPEVLSKQLALSVDPEFRYSLRIVKAEYDTYELDSPYIVGRGTITGNQDPDQVPYKISKLSKSLTKYPSKQIELEENFSVRNMSGFVFRFNVTEFNINQNTVKVYKHLEFELVPYSRIDDLKCATDPRNTEVVPETCRVFHLQGMHNWWQGIIIMRSYRKHAKAYSVLF